MALPKAGVSLVVENDKAFKDALSEVNSGLRVNKSELQLVTAQTQNLDDRQAALQARYQAVENTLQSYRDKVAILTQAYENCAEREGEGSKKTMEWKNSLTQAQTAVARTENELVSMPDDVTVRKIPRYEVSNDCGGVTLIMGDEYFNG